MALLSLAVSALIFSACGGPVANNGTLAFNTNGCAHHRLEDAIGLAEAKGDITGTGAITEDCRAGADAHRIRPPRKMSTVP